MVESVRVSFARCRSLTSMVPVINEIVKGQGMFVKCLSSEFMSINCTVTCGVDLCYSDYVRPVEVYTS